jgi:hypothetical protein
MKKTKKKPKKTTTKIQQKTKKQQQKTRTIHDTLQRQKKSKQNRVNLLLVCLH